MPNGIVFSPNESRPYIADTGGHAKQPDPELRKLPDAVHCYAVGKDGELGARLFSIDEGSDGLAVDINGHLYTPHGSRVNIHDVDRRKLEHIDVPEDPANVCFGGKDFKNLFITARTPLYSIRMTLSGAKIPGSR